MGRQGRRLGLANSQLLGLVTGRKLVRCGVAGLMFCLRSLEVYHPLRHRLRRGRSKPLPKLSPASALATVPGIPKTRCCSSNMERTEFSSRLPAPIEERRLSAGHEERRRRLNEAMQTIGLDAKSLVDTSEFRGLAPVASLHVIRTVALCPCFRRMNSLNPPCG